MAASSAGSSAVFTFALLTISCLVILLLRNYLPLRTTPAYLLLPVFLAIVLPASIILLVPVDLASSAVVDDGTARGIWLPERTILVLWRISYWLTFVLTWLILPLLGEYVDSGHREPRQRMLYSLRSNAKFQLIVLACAGAGLVYFFYENGFVVTSLKSLVMALAYAWGLVLVIYLMGHGLVAVPRKLYRNASISRRLRNLESQAPKVHERLTEALEDMDDFEDQVMKLHQRKTGTARDYRDWIEELVETSNLPESRPGLLAPTARNTESAVPTVITERYLADLTRKLKRARHKRIRFIDEWDRHVREARCCQDILDATGSRKLEFRMPLSSNSWLTRLSPLSPATRYYLHANVLPICRLLTSFLFAIASVCIVWSEVSEVLKSAFPKMPVLSIVGISLIHHPNSTTSGKIGFGGQFMAAAWLLYMCAAALFSVTEVKIWGNRALVKRNTYAESACWYASLVARLTVPLAYNFIRLVPPDISNNTTFYRILGQSIDLTPIGTGFSEYFPIFILLPVIATTFNLYSRVRNIAGFGAFEDDSDGSNPNSIDAWREGRALLEREWNGMAANITALGLSSTSSPRARSPLPPQDHFTDGYSSHTNLNAASTTAAATNGGLLSAPPNSERQRFTVPQAQPPRTPQNTRYEDEPGGASEGNFFEEFAHRVRNTIDTAPKPDWVARLPKPKWMARGGGGDQSSGNAGSGSTGGGGLGRFFSEGGLRL